MAKPYIHAESSARKFGGKPDDYIDIHQLLDSSKAVFPDNRHRCLTHHSFFLFILEKIFGVTRINSDGRKYSTRDIGEQHILEDFGGKFIPTPQDYLQEMEFKDWMFNGKTHPDSYKKIEGQRNTKTEQLFKPLSEIPADDPINKIVFDGSLGRTMID